MKVFIGFLFIAVFPSVFALPVHAQDEEETIVRIWPRKSDGLILEFTNDFWLDVPEGVELRPVSVGFKGHFYIDHAFGNSAFSFAWGLGISADNVHSNARPIRIENLEDSESYMTFSPYPDEHEYEKNKFVTTYLELPLEFRVITRERTHFKLAFGMRFGYLLSDHWKIIDEVGGKRKEYDFDDVTKWRYGVNARIGVGKFSLTGFYSLTPLFEEDKGIPLIPVSVGLTFAPF